MVSVAYLVDGIRTPIGRYAGALSAVRPDDLAAHVLRALRARHPSVDWSTVDDVLLGCVNQAGEDNRNVARMALLLAGLPDTVSGATINRLCGSGADAVAERGSQPGELVQVCFAGMLVLRHVHRIAIAPRHQNRRDLLLEVLLSLRRPLL